MKKLIVFSALTFVALAVRAALPEPDLLARIHFAGTQKISTEKNAADFNNTFGCAEAIALRHQTADRLAPWLAGWLNAKLGTSVTGGAAKLRPLLDDLQQSEWFLEARTGANGQAQAALAIKLDAAHAKIWETALKPYFAGGTFQQTGGWLIFDSGTAGLKLSGVVAQASKSSAADVASLDVNWPRLAKWYPRLKELALPQTRFVITSPDEDFRVAGKLFFPESLNLNLEAWQFPSNLVHQPFVSFTAARGFAAWLKTQNWARDFQITSSPNQLYIWALQQIPYQTFAAAPVANAADALSQLYTRLSPAFAPQNPPTTMLMPFKLVKSTNEIVLQGAPFVAPYIQALREPEGQFLLAGAFPNTPRSKPLPPELFQRLSQKNLLLYHWEITAERLPLALQLSQLTLLLSEHRQLPSESASIKWIQHVAPKLGNTVTEVFQTGPAEMSFNRKAPGIFTALELLALGSWLEAPDFPHCNLNLPPRPTRLKRTPPRVPLSTPAPAPAVSPKK